LYTFSFCTKLILILTISERKKIIKTALVSSPPHLHVPCYSLYLACSPAAGGGGDGSGGGGSGGGGG